MKVLLMASLGLLTLAAPAQSQTSVTPRVALPLAPQENPAVAAGDAEWALRVSPRLVQALGSPSATVRAAALHAVGTLAVVPAEGVDLRPAVPALLTVFHTDPDWRLRVMALRSLEAADDEETMAVLRREVGRPAPPPLQRVLLAVLVNHYGTEAARNDADMVALAQSLLDHYGRAPRGSAGGRLVAAR